MPGLGGKENKEMAKDKVEVYVTVRKCKECPYATRNVEGESSRCSMTNKKCLEETGVPDWCPFFFQGHNKAFKEDLENPNLCINCVYKRKDSPSPTYNSSWGDYCFSPELPIANFIDGSRNRLCSEINTNGMCPYYKAKKENNA
jgi:hypothetical protein